MCASVLCSIKSLTSMNDLAKRIDRAEKLLEKGKPELALAEYRAAIELEPENLPLLQKAADLSMSLGQLGLASDMLRRLFAQYVEGKQLSEAAAVFRRLQRIKALDPEMVIRYAELCVSTSRKDAAEAYRIAFEEFQRLGDPRRALHCMTRSLELDPRMEDYREHARICEALHEPVLAAESLVQLAVMLERLGQDASSVYARAHNDDPSNMAARLGHGRALIAQNRPAEAVELLQPLATYPSSPEEAREPYALALLALGRVEEAEPFAWRLFERNPGVNLPALLSIIGGLVDRDLVDRALALARRLEDFNRKAGRLNGFLQNLEQIAAERKPSIVFFEYLAALYNSANRELEYSQVLSRLFDLYFESENYSKALDALDRAVDIDPYEAQHKDRMQKLSGHAPEDRLQTVAKRLGVDPPEQNVVTTDEEESATETPAPRVLEDLILQSEIFLQYGMRDKALQKIEQIKQSFAVEMENDPRVRQLFVNAGLAAPASREDSVEQTRPSEGMVRLLALSQRLTAIEPVFRAADVQISEPLSPIRPELGRLNVHSLVALSLLSEDQPIGLLIVQQCGVRRRWSPDDLALLRSLADQVALAVHGARLRSLVSTLGVAEEKTGLLKRSSYIDAVVAELGRQRAGGDFISTLALLQVSSLTSTQSEQAIAELVRTLRSIAQDQAMLFRYESDTVALLLPHLEIPETEALVAQLRDALEPIAITITAGIAKAGPFAGFEPEDAATEWINRVARALAVASTLTERICTLPPTSASIA